MKPAIPMGIGDTAQFAECYLFTLIDGTNIYVTNFDRPLTTPGPDPPGGYGLVSFLTRRLAREAMTWNIGVQPSELRFEIGVGGNDLVELGLDWRVAAARGLLDW